MKQSIHKTPTSTSYKNYEREIYMSEYVTLPRDQVRMMKVREVIAWGIAVFMVVITFIRQGNNMAIINNDKEALTHALILGITAPSDEALDKVMSIAQEISDRLSDEEIEQCKKEAIAWIDEQEMKKRDEEQSTIHQEVVCFYLFYL